MNFRFLDKFTLRAKPNRIMGDQDNQLSGTRVSTVLSSLTVCVHCAKLAENITSIKNERSASFRALNCLHSSQGGD